ncbi:MAG: helix-turn-helix domain-containing protein [Thermoflavifilum sp.]|nr:helix-turn-helix domain-containing protein [Thermoflavifilum sp.]
MRIVPFKIPKTRTEFYHYQIDRLNHFYDKLHQHPEVQITYIEKGRGNLIVGDYTGRFSSGDVLIIGSSLPHVFKSDEIYYLQKTKQSVGYSLYIDMKAWEQEFWKSNDTLSVARFFHQCYQAYQLQGTLAKEVATRLVCLRRLSGFRRALFILDMLYLIFEHRAELKLISDGGWLKLINEHQDTRMSNIIRFTLEEYHRPISLQEVARVANLSVEAFCRYFKTHTRKTYVSFLNEVRIHHACRLLAERAFTFSEIAYQVGFSNLSYFNRIFKRITRKTPGEYVMMLSKQ